MTSHVPDFSEPNRRILSSAFSFSIIRNIEVFDLSNNFDNCFTLTLLSARILSRIIFLYLQIVPHRSASFRLSFHRSAYRSIVPFIVSHRSIGVIIGAILCNIYYDMRRFFYDVGATFHDIGVLNNHLEGRVIAKQEFSRITFVFFKKRRNSIDAATETVDITKIQHYLGDVWIAIVGLIRKVLQIHFAIKVAGIINLDAVAVFVKLYRRVKISVCDYEILSVTHWALKIRNSP